MDVDVAIIGGSFAGLSAGLFLANSRQQVMIIDAGNPANAPARHMHNLLGSENKPPLVFLADARKQVAKFRNVLIENDIVTTISIKENLFHVKAVKTAVTAKKIIMATGIRHILPDIQNIAEFWVHNIFHCPYCFGPEVINQALGIYANNNKLLEQVMLMQKWSNNFVVLTDGIAKLSRQEKIVLDTHHINVYTQKIISFSGDPGKKIVIHFEDGSTIALRGIFMHPKLDQQAPDLVKQLNLTSTKNGLLKLTKRYETTTKGIYAAGDAACEIQKVPTAIASGSLAGFYADGDLAKLKTNT